MYLFFSAYKAILRMKKLIMDTFSDIIIINITKQTILNAYINMENWHKV